MPLTEEEGYTCKRASERSAWKRERREACYAVVVVIATTAAAA